uniref:Lipase n=1 Tax=Steinernema glaseri TaxID=37863 RepID=A0A1I7ZWD9_9BILA
MWTLIFIALFFAYSSLAQKGPLTEDFQSWLRTNGYEGDDFARLDLGDTGSFGGFQQSNQTVRNTPVIFIHGNSDGALDNGQLDQTGWSASIKYFLDHDFSSGELHIRRFVQAVLAYTKSSKVNIIAHSMGVTLARKAVKGGRISAADGNCNLGAPLTSSINVFVALAGANYGMCNCEDAAAFMSPTCNRQNGFWPGDACGINVADCGSAVLAPCVKPPYASFLTDLNSDPTREAKYVFSAWSLMDNMIMYGDQVWGRPTSLIPGSSNRKVYDLYDHFQTKDLTCKDQYSMVVYKSV